MIVRDEEEAWGGGIHEGWFLPYMFPLVSSC